MHGERAVAGVRCGQVLAELTDYLDGDLTPERRERIEAHVRGCDHCARFGGVFSATVAALRASLDARELDSGVRSRLGAALEGLER